MTSTIFDWHTLVANNKPSQTSTLQLARLEALPKLTADLKKWTEQYNLGVQRLEAAAYTGCVTMPAPFSYQKSLILAKYVLWVYNFDAYVDHFDCSQFDLTNPKILLDYLDSQLSYIIKPLHQLGGLTFEQGHSYGLEFSFDKINDFQRIENTSLNLKEALQSLYHDLQTSWQHSHSQELHNTQKLKFSLTNFTQYLAKTLGAMRWEIIQSFNYQQSVNYHQLPDMEEYLSKSNFSIGLHPAGAIVAGYETDPAPAWQLCTIAMEISAEIVRLANDLGNYWSELEERKVTSITIALAKLGFPPMGPYQKGSQEVQRAKEIVKARLEVKLEHFSQQTVEISNIPLLQWLYLCLAFALAMYDRGNYVIPD